MSEQVVEKTGNAFTKKIGPLPGFAWAGIVVGIAYAVHFWQRNRVGAAQAAPETITANTTGFTSAGPMPGTNDYSGAVSQAEKAAPASTTNAQWARNTADSMIASGSNPTDVNTALANYLSGKSLTPTQQAIVNVALQKYGNPPEGVIAPVTEPAFGGHRYTVQAGDTIDSIVQKFYGRSSEIDKRLVADNNPGVLSWLTDHWSAPAAGTILKLPMNGISGVQNNSLVKTYNAAGG